jgi:hypothetical protein
MRMRKLRTPIAIWLLACFGMMLPAAATPLRVCFIGTHLAIAAEDTGCCHDCNRPTEGPQPCCMDLESLPDASTPEAAVLLPPVPICLLPAPHRFRTIRSDRFRSGGLIRQAPGVR